MNGEGEMKKQAVMNAVTIFFASDERCKEERTERGEADGANESRHRRSPPSSLHHAARSLDLSSYP